MKAILVCVNYDDLLAITLPRNIQHFDECLVVTSPADVRTQRLVEHIPNCRTYATDAFYRNGAKFNKGAAMEEGFDQLGRSGWIQILDADILLPSRMTLPDLNPNHLYGAPRRVFADAANWAYTCCESDWGSFARARNDYGMWGYFQLFHASSESCRAKPWYDTTFTHAGCSDEMFMNRWPPSNRTWLPFTVLHLGPTDQNWCGRATPRIDGHPVTDEAALFNRSLRAHFGWIHDKGPVIPIQERVQQKKQ